MVNQAYKNMLKERSVIRELAEFAAARGKEIGFENVFDYTMGNPSVPCAESYTQAIINLHQTQAPAKIHSYGMPLGVPAAREAVATSLNKRFDMDYDPKHIFITTGAAGALAHALRAVTVPGDEVLTFAPYFPEYTHFVNFTGATLKVVPANIPDFQINFQAFEAMLTPQVTAVLMNTPNNPSGVVYSRETLEKLAALLSKKQAEYGHDIFLLSDEPYRELLFSGIECPYVSKFYDNTISCYSFSKSLSLPGERLGYVAVSPRATDGDVIAAICGQISRGIGHNGAATSIQLSVAEVIDELSDISVYETNMNLLYNALVRLGFEVNKPDGTFYIFPKALEEDATVFCMKAKEYDLFLVPSESFGVDGYFRMAYCIDTEKVERSIVALEKFVAAEYSK